MFFIFFFLFLFLNLKGVLAVFFLDWFFFSVKFNFCFRGLVFSVVLTAVVLSVLVFSSYYLKGELYFYYYLFVLSVFVLRMYSLNFRFNAFSMLLRWDLLGISSFFLVLFYNNWDSCRGAINTVLTNRLGDYFLFVSFSIFMFLGSRFIYLNYIFFFLLLILAIAAFTKSAQFPFRGWLPKAISAPTPVRSLVHRRTLVTAGLLLLFNFNLVLLGAKVSIVVFFTGLFTILFSSLRAVLEEDLKKVVALRTLSQMGLSIVVFSLGVPFIALIHLLSHALFKRCLFLQVGALIHISFGQQDGRFYTSLFRVPYFIQLQLLITLFCLCGLMFFRGLVSKDLILEFFFRNFWFFVVVSLFFVTVYITFFYSYRLWKSLFLKFNSRCFHFSSRVLINFTRVLVALGSIFFVWWLCVNLVFIPSLFIFFDFYTPIFYLLLFLIIYYFSIKLNFKLFFYKFLADYIPKLLRGLFFSSKYIENAQFNFSLQVSSILIFFRSQFIFYLLRNGVYSILFLVFFCIFLF